MDLITKLTLTLTNLYDALPDPNYANIYIYTLQLYRLVLIMFLCLGLVHFPRCNGT